MSPAQRGSRIPIAAGLVALVAHAPAQETVRGAPGDGAVRIVRALRDPDPPPLEELARELAREHPAPVADLLAMLERRRVPALEGAPPQALSEPQQELILAALSLSDRGAVYAGVAARLEESLDVPARVVAIQVLGGLAYANELSTLFDLALISVGEVLDGRVEAAFQRSLARTLARDPAGYHALGKLWRRARPELLPALIFALGQARDPRGLELLSELIAWRPEHAVHAISQVRRLGPGDSPALNSRVCEEIRTFLDPTEVESCRAASAALAAMQDCDSVGALIDLLEHESAGVRGNAHWALREISGLAFGPQRHMWAMWHESELRWLEQQHADVLARLVSDDAGQVASAIRSLSERGLYRRERAGELAALLSVAPPAQKVLACNGLARLRSASAVPELIETLEVFPGEAGRAAWTALREITGLDLPQDAAAWRSPERGGGESRATAGERSVVLDLGPLRRRALAPVPD